MARHRPVLALWRSESVKHISRVIADMTEPLEVTPEQLRTMPYEDYLQTAHWQKVREDTLRRFDHRCVVCRRPASDVHHRTYERRGCELPNDVVALCRNCHARAHGKRRPAE